ncbi:PAS domain S-box protein [Roseateles saccharophilus]|uniref:histidine kinase n=1 Tax=Roseateles saccharophilus TaxID=304 RepID=A0A4R3V0U4_ROSSA|nr:PAS domain S-box protein [Roseateles saccharophilus]MDG0832347.1 PAS domain S-box protein [Roseateles saccharophilus]TCU97041.1 PAS domain S-box-containing protein [Roseateles saccharophilus]
MDELTGVVARAGFLPHGYCFQWSPGLLWSMVGADLATALAYFSIPLVIASYARQRPQVNLGSLATLFAIFIFACGITHVLDVWTIWRPDYGLQTSAKVFTALASVLTAGVAWRLMPKLLALPSAEEMRVANEALRREMDRRHSAEDHLLEAEQNLAATLASIDAGFLSTDEAGRVKRLNPVAEHITGWPAAEALGRSVWEVFVRDGAPADPGSPIELLRERERDGAFRRQAVCIGRDGTARPIEVHAELTRHADGRVRGVAIVFRDVGRLTEAEAEVRRLAAVVESSADAIIVKSLDGRITNWNAAAERMFGYTAAQAVGQPVQMLVPPEREAEEARIRAELARGQQVPPQRTVRVASDGRRIEVSVQFSLLRDAAGRVIGAVKSARDLTHQRQIEAALRQSEARLRFALESAAIGDWEMELEGGRIHRSRRYDQCFGLPDAGGDWDRERLLAAVHADDRAMVEAALNALQTRTEGHLPWHAEFRVAWPDDSMHWLRLDARVTGDDAGSPRLVGIVADVTAMRTAEQARQQAIWLAAENRRVQESSRLKSLFLANMSHELRTPLNAVIGFADLLTIGAHPPDPVREREWLQHIASSGRHLLNMINDVLDLSKIEAGKMDFHPEPVALPALVDDVMATVAVLAGQRGLSLTTVIAPELRDLVLDPARLRQVLLNYLSNAIKFTPAGGRVELRMLGEGPRLWRLEVEDSGIGIASERLDQLFVEFQQLDDGLTKRHQGTGLGLALTRRLVKAQGGRVGVYSEAGRGSCFYAVLPRRPGDADVDAPGPQQLVALGDHPLRDGLARELAQAGVNADTAATAAEMLRLARERRYTELAIDLALPDSPGLATLAALRTGGPSMHAAVKALALNAPAGAGVAFPVSDVLAKPLRRAALARALVPLRQRFGPGRPVLVVDDEAAARELMCAALLGHGIEAIAVAGGAEALQALPALRPAAVVLDLMMPGVDGFQVLHELRRDPRWAELPVIVWTSLILSAEDIQALARSAAALDGRREPRPEVRDALLRAARQDRRGRRQTVEGEA